MLETIALDFREFGRSGGKHDLPEILSGLMTEAAGVKTAVKDFSISRLEKDGNWRMVFHQGERQLPDPAYFSR